MEKIKSVNLGGWFVLERWMKPSLFEETNHKERCETSFVLHHPSPRQTLESHWQTWITKDDIHWLKENGINLVRIPIPWWLFPDTFQTKTPYISPLQYIHQAMDFIDSEGMKVMLDLHTAPGSQNGFDNGGIDGVLTWHLDSKNIDMTIEVLKMIALEFKDHRALHSLQVLNEPHMSIDISIIEDFYDRSYLALRQILKPETYIVFHDSFRLHHWVPFFQTRNWKNVILDTHIYQCFSDYFNQITETEFLNHPFKIAEELEKIDQVIPLVVGEWSLGARHFETSKSRIEFEQAFFNNQLTVFSKITGWIFWSYKISDYESGWNFRGLVERGIIAL